MIAFIDDHRSVHEDEPIWADQLKASAWDRRDVLLRGQGTPFTVLVKHGATEDDGGACADWPASALPKSSGKNVTPMWHVGIPTAISGNDSGFG